MNMKRKLQIIAFCAVQQAMRRSCAKVNRCICFIFTSLILAILITRQVPVDILALPPNGTNSNILRAILHSNNNNQFFAKTFYPCIAVLVESRATDLIMTVVHNVNYHIPSTWPIQIFHGRENQHFIENSTLAPLIRSGKVFLALIDNFHGKSGINRLLTDPNFWNRVPGEKILFFQTDSIMCSNSPHKVTDFLQYDFIGAPWNPQWFYRENMRVLVGNGGFSLRTRSKLLALLKILSYNTTEYEDIWFSLNLHLVNASIPPVDIAKTFAVELVYYPRPVAVHRALQHCDAIRNLTITCPEAAIIRLENC